MSITIYEQLKRAKKGEVLYTASPARNVTSAAHRTNRKVSTAMCLVYPMHSMDNPRRIIRIKVLS